MGFLSKIAGTMLKDNLVRNGVDLAIDTDLMYFDVSNRRVGINTTMPTDSLTVIGSSTLSNININNNTISSLSGNIIIASSGNVSVANNFINDLKDPKKAQDAATKNYVDNIVSGNMILSDGVTFSSIPLYSEPLILLGSRNQVLVSVLNNTATIGLADNLNLPGQTTTDRLVTSQGVYWPNGSSLLGDTLTVSEIDDQFNISNVLTAVTSLRFDKSTGFSVTSILPGEAKISLGSSFKTWVVSGQSNLVARAEDTVQFVAGSGISITTDPNATIKSITFSTVQSGFDGSNAIVISNSTVSSSSTTGALTVNGGVGIVGNLYVGSSVNSGNLITQNGLFWSNGVAFATSVYSNANVSAYLISNPQPGLYSNANVSAYLISNPEPGLYSNANVSNFLPNYLSSYTGNINAGNVNVSTGIYSPAYYYANGSAFTSSNYGNAQVGAYLNALGVGATLVTSDSFIGDGTSTTFTLSQPSTTAGTIVSINGVLQLPTTSYTVIGNSLSLIEAPLTTDLIDARTIVAATTIMSSYNDANVAAYLPNYSGILKVGAYTATALRAITGSIGSMASVSNSVPGGRIAFWDTTNNRWSYISDNSAV
jgi:hypothetical protein